MVYSFIQPLPNCFRAKGIKSRQTNNEPVAGFFTQIGNLYGVEHLWGKLGERPAWSCPKSMPVLNRWNGIVVSQIAYYEFFSLLIFLNYVWNCLTTDCCLSRLLLLLLFCTECFHSFFWIAVWKILTKERGLEIILLLLWCSLFSFF